MSSLCQVKNLQYKDGKHAVQISPDWQYIHLQDLEKFLGLNRVNVRGKDTTKIKARDAKKKVRDCKFIHVKHLGSLCLRSERPVKTKWILEQYETRLAMHTKINVFSNAFKERSHKDIIREVLENFWTRLPKVVVTTLENMVGLKGFVDQLRAADELLRTKDFDRKWQDALDKREEKKRDE